MYYLNTLRPRQNGRHFADDIFKCIFLNENVWIPIKISMKFLPKGPINNIPALVQIMAWRRPGDKPLSEPMMVSLTTHICFTRPPWVNVYISYRSFLNILLQQLFFHSGSIMAANLHYSDVIMSAVASKISSLTIVHSGAVYSGADQRKHQKLRVAYLWEGNSPVTDEFPHKGSVTRKMFPFDDVIMWQMTTKRVYICMYTPFSHWIRFLYCHCTTLKSVFMTAS